MDKSELYALMLTGKRYKRSAGQVVQSFEENMEFSLVKSGYVKRYLISNQGTLGVQSIYGPGYYFPLTAVFAGLNDLKIYRGAEQYYYEAMTKVEIYSISIAKLRGAVSTNPLLYKELFAETGKRLQSNIQQIENVSFKDPYRRVAHQLVFYATLFPEENINGIKIAIPLKHQDLADILNLNRETVTRAVVKLRKQNLIKTDDSIVVLDIDLLKSVYR